MADTWGMSYTPLAKVLGTYQAYLEASSPKKSTHAYGRCATRKLLEHFGEDANAEDLSTADVEGFCAARTAAGVSRATVNGNLAMLRAALRRAVDDRVLAAMPCRVKLLRVGKRIPRTLDGEAVGRLLAASPRPWVRAVLALAAYAGLRHGEILHLQRDDIDFAEGVVRVTAKDDWSPKSHCERAVPLSRPLEAELRCHLAEIPEDPEAWLFPGYEGRARAEATVEVREAFLAAGLYDPKAKPGLHQLRRTWATAALEVADIETVRQLGGWADLVTVQRYVGSTDARKRRAIARLYEEKD